MIPPIRSHINAAWERLAIMEEKATTTSQPIPMYSTDDTQCGQVIQHILKTVPIMVMLHTVISRGMPMFLGRTIRHTGVYEPAIRTKIIA